MILRERLSAKAIAYLRASPFVIASSASTLDRLQKKNPEQSILGACSSLCLRLFCPGDLGVLGDGGKSPEGPTPPILPNPARAKCDDRHKFGALGICYKTVTP
jgi:hypothetical protein